MNPGLEAVRQELEQALTNLAGSRGDELARRVRPILFANLDRGRAHESTVENPDLIREYVEGVVDRFVILHEYIHKIQVDRSAEVWEPLFPRMQTWAFNYFVRKGFSADGETQELAVECAAEAALNLLNAYFPYDTEFDAWAHIIVQNACRKFIGRAFRKSVVPDDQIVALEDDLLSLEDLALEMQGEAKSELADALDLLSDARRAVLHFIYFEELEPEEIAQRMGKTVGAVYSLQFHGLKDLRKILRMIRDNVNE